MVALLTEIDGLVSCEVLVGKVKQTAPLSFCLKRGLVEARLDLHVVDDRGAGFIVPLIVSGD